MNKIHLALLLTLVATNVGAQHPTAGADEKTPSHSEYFSWINNTNEGATEKQTLINLDFFKWLNRRYGMQLDIYAFDAGAIDGAKHYGSTRSARFKEQFPRGFKPLSQSAAEMGTRLGLWCGPDGFGNTPEEAEERSEMMVGLVRDYNFQLFKMDGVCGPLRPSKYDYFNEMMTRVRHYSPDFVLLNHRLDLGPGTKHSTTFLLGGAETYIDVHMTNNTTATHHRARAIARETPQNLTRLTEDHGVCLSSCLDYWEDDLVLQAFGRELILAPEIYGNPWLLADDEFSYLAYLFNLHRDYRDILVNALRLDEAHYGPEALSRGDGDTRFITLRNLTWNTVRYSVTLNEEVGLTTRKNVKARLYHPYILDMGSHAYGTTIEVEVKPFRTALLKVTTAKERDAVALSGIPYQIVNDRVGDIAELKLLGMPGSTHRLVIEQCSDRARKVKIGDTDVSSLLKHGRTYKVRFPGIPLKNDYHRLVATMTACDAIPDDISSIYYATCFAADNNALELRELKRSGPTAVPEVQAARDAFFGQDLFVKREISDANLFDDDPATAFSIMQRWGDPRPSRSSGFFLDMGSPVELDRLTIDVPDEYSLSPNKSYEGVVASVSADLSRWTELTFIVGTHMDIDLSQVGPVRYVRFAPCPLRVSEVRGYKDGKAVDRSRWRASNLFSTYGSGGYTAGKVWSTTFTLDEIPRGAYLCVAIPGNYGGEGAWAGFKVDGAYVGCPDRAPSFKSNTWECPVNSGNGNYTYFLPLTPDMKGRTIEAFAMTFGKQSQQGADAVEEPKVWVTAYPIPFESKPMTIE